MKYPNTKKENIQNVLFGKTIADPYRWLEDDYSEETQSWLKDQNNLTDTFLSQSPDRQKIYNRLQELNNYQKKSLPVKRGNWYYYYLNTGLQNQYVLYRQKSPDSEPELFFDPNTLSEDGTTTASSAGRSKDNRYFAYKISKAGADASEIRIMDTETGTFHQDILKNVTHTGTSWYKDGFYYSKYDSEDLHLKQYRNQKIFYHKLGDDFSNDQLIYEDPEHPLRYNHAFVSDDEKYLFISISEGTSGNEFKYKSLQDKNSDFKILVKGFENNYDFLFDYEEDFIILKSNKNAPNRCLYKVDLRKPDENNWQLIVPERDYLLDTFENAAGKMILIYTKDCFSKIEICSMDGQIEKEINMPYLGCASFFRAEKEDTEGYFFFDSFTVNTQIYKYDFITNELAFFYSDPVLLDFSQYVSEQVFFASKDGTRVPMTLNYKKGLIKDGQRPVHLYGYGGFNAGMYPSFNPDRSLLMDKGGIFIVVNLRGGSEYGEEWHKAGMLLNKQNVFDDFISAAEYMIRENYTNPEKIAITGGSNGGLLVGACLTQRPDLFKVAVPSMGVLDMLRYHKFTCGWGWVVEYGNPDEELHFHNLLQYSPLHNVQQGEKYPATLIVTADHDDRVIPGHSFKFAAELQEKAATEQPVLLYVQSNSSHGFSSMDNYLKMQSDIKTFMFMMLGI